jgi:hypothetical protein
VRARSSDTDIEEVLNVEQTNWPTIVIEDGHLIDVVFL